MEWRAEILVVDDDPVCLRSLENILEPEFRVVSFTDPALAKLYLDKQSVDLVLLDLNFAHSNGLELLKSWKASLPDLDIVFCSGETRVERAIECLRNGASDYITKPLSRENVLFIVGRALEKAELRKSVARLQSAVKPAPVDFVAESPQMKTLLKKVNQLKGQYHLNILILGESGTGKEVIARHFHQQEGNSQRPFVPVNMAALPNSLVESELFGIEKGAFTDAKQSRAGKFEQAHKGDIFLDEIGDLAFETQAKLLRVLQERQVVRVGGTRQQRVNFRLIAATNHSLSEKVAEKSFREDLLYRLSDFVLVIPPLRERVEDIVPLTRHFIAKYWNRGALPTLSPSAISQITHYSWPGNVRQLQSAVKRTLLSHSGGPIPLLEILDIQDLTPVTPLRITFDEQLDNFQKRTIGMALSRNNGDRQATIKELGMSRATFYRKVQQLGIPLHGAHQ